MKGGVYGYKSQMTHLLTWLPSWIFLVKESQLSLPHFIGAPLMQQVGCSVVPACPVQRICMGGVYLWCQDDLPNTSTWMMYICGAGMTCLTYLHGWCISVVHGWWLSVVTGWPAKHIFMSGVYSPIYSPSKWQSFSTCVSDHSQVQPIFINGV